MEIFNGAEPHVGLRLHDNGPIENSDPEAFFEGSHTMENGIDKTVDNFEI